ncbi:MAG: DUF1007 family protein [Desulfovibrionales bacterium]|nr:DUF1007 family protein [Desulfovibrionales bacterium]
MRYLVILFLAAMLCMPANLVEKAQAHPHVFIDSSLVLKFDEQGLAYLDVVWTFDEMSSDMFLIDLDTNADGALTTDEWAAQKNDIASYLGENSFFVHVVVNKKQIQLSEITNFVATYEAGILRYAMRLPLRIADDAGTTAMQVAIFDPSYYTDFYTALEAVTVSGKKSLELSIDDAPELAFYQGQVIPTAVTFEF